MKAWVLHDIGDIRYEDVNKPEIGENEVIVSVKAVGICGSDIPRIYRDGAHRMPLIPGHEFAGEVVEAGKGVGEEWLNKKVGVFPLIPCNTCIACIKARYEMCRNYSYLGSRCNGAFAEYVAVPKNNLIELPEGVLFEQAAMLEPMSVAVHAMRRVLIKQSDVVAVCGLGTIGMLLIMFLLERGIRKLFVIGNKNSQREKAISLGLPDNQFCDSRFEDVNRWLMKCTEGAGADVFFECVGRNETVSQAINLTAPGGYVCLVGNPYSDMLLNKQTYWKILRNQLNVTGTWNSSFSGEGNDKASKETDWYYVLDLIKQKRIAPENFISHRFNMEELDKGLHIMRDKSEEYIKIMVIK
ncbi:MAG: galactitol-1-phosphate 5-dehydrogenase [Lachnospiraceae bacterium]|nr:galactitol-1-phosphate 5-dehydrogenase [Lachnospiraceae bacterium]